MKKFILSFIIFLTVFLTFLYQIKHVFLENSKFENFQLTLLIQNVPINERYINKRLLCGHKIAIEFKAKENNLAIIEFLFNNYQKINNDRIIFRIRERGTKVWYYENIYDSSKFDIGQFYPFGFPPISESKGKVYEIEILSIKGTEKDSISISPTAKYFQAKYSFPKNYLNQNKKIIPYFIFNKLKNILIFFKPIDIVRVILVLFIEYSFLKMLSKFYKVFLSKKKLSISKLLFKILFFLKNNILIIFIVIFYSLTRLQFLGYSQYWDANWYLELLDGAINSITSERFNLINMIKVFLKDFNVLGHPSMGYMGIMSLTQILNRGNVVFLNVGNMLLSIIAIWAFYKIVTYFYPNKIIENVLITIIFVFNPLFYATSIFFNLDFPLLVFSILLFESYIFKRKFWYIFWSTMLVFSKETGIFIYLSFFSSFNYFEIVKKGKFFNKDKILRIIYLFIPIILFLFYLFYSKGQLWNNESSSFDESFKFVWRNNCNFCIGFNLTNIKTRLFQIYIMNFSWLMSSIIIFSIIKSIISRKKILNTFDENKKHLSKVILFVFIFFVLFNLLVVVMNFPRYVVTSVFFLILIFYFSNDFLFSKTMLIKKLFLFIIAVLMFIQTFKAIDPSPQILFGSRYIGKNVSSPIFGSNDGMVFNSEFIFIDKITNMININSSKDIGLINDKYTSYFFKNLKFVGSLENLDELFTRGYEKLRYVYVPWLSSKEDFFLKVNNLYAIKNSEIFDYKGFYVEVYDLEKVF